MMKARFMIENPSEIEATMEITMNLKMWKELQKQLSEAHPSWKLSSYISDLLYQAEQTFYPKETP